ncbi:hypothetical protein DKP79_28790, partial [Klebsiella pneumoniae]
GMRPLTRLELAPAIWLTWQYPPQMGSGAARLFTPPPQAPAAQKLGILNQPSLPLQNIAAPRLSAAMVKARKQDVRIGPRFRT